LILSSSWSPLVLVSFFRFSLNVSATDHLTLSGFFIGLNVVRIFSVIGLLLVFSSSIFVMVNDVRAVNHFMSVQGSSTESLLDCDYIENSTVPNQAAGVFWAVLNRLLIILETIVLLMAEGSPPIIGRFFDRFFPVLGPSFGLGALGIFQCLIGATILSHHVDDFTLVSAFFLFSVGCLNMLVGLIFRERAKGYRSIPGYRAYNQEVLPTHIDNRPPFAGPPAGEVAAMFDKKRTPSFTTAGTASMYEEKDYGYGADKRARYEADFNSIAVAKAGNSHSQPQERDFAGYGFGRQGEKAAGLKGFLITKPRETVSRYAPSPRPTSVASSSRASSSTRGGSDRGRSTSRSGSRLAHSGGLERSHSPATSNGASSRGSSPERAQRPVPTFHSSPTAL
jgi:hypothetical protein